MHAETYAQLFAVEDTHWWFAGKRRLARVFLDQLPAQRDRKILDVGCGTGGMFQLLGEYGSLWGVDLSETALAFAARRDRAQLQRAELPHLPFADATFDLVTLFGVLYHRAVGDDVAALREVARVLRSGGHALFTDPAFRFLRGPHDADFHGARRYTTGEMCAKLRDAGFILRRASYADCLIFPAAAPWRLARRAFGTSEGSDVRPVPAWLNAIMGWIYRLEAALLARTNLPVGLSIIVLAQKT